MVKMSQTLRLKHLGTVKFDFFTHNYFYMKDVIFLAAKRSPKRTPNGDEIENEYVGNFRRRVDASTKGALHYHGIIEATKKKYDYYAVEADVIRGHVRWVDVQTDKFGTSIALYVESERFLFRLSFDYDVQNLRQIANYLSGMKAELDSYFFNITFDAWKEKDKDGGFKLMDNGAPRWSTAVKFGDARPFVDPKGMREYLEQKGLAWEKSFDATKNKEVYNSTKEMVFWLKTILAIQKHLLTTENVLPFTYNSILACANPHPSGCGNLSDGERASCAAIYEAIKSEYRFPFGRSMQDADDVFGTPQPAQETKTEELSTPSNTAQPTRGGFADPVSVPLPTHDTTNFEVGAFADDELPMF